MLEGKWRDLPDEAKQIWLWGTDDSLEFTWRGGRRAKKYSGSFEGFIPELLARYKTTRNKMQLRQFEKYMSTMDCPDCHGKRLNPQASAVTIQTGAQGLLQRAEARQRSTSRCPNFANCRSINCAMFFSEIVLGETEAKIAAEALKEIRQRHRFPARCGARLSDAGTHRADPFGRRIAADSAWPGRSAADWSVCCTFWMNRRSDCTRETTIA